jgi:GH18 family chitinase
MKSLLPAAPFLRAINCFAIYIFWECSHLLDTTELRSDGFVGSHGRNVVCYVSSWAAYRPDRGNFSLSALDPKICTHFVYAFAGLNETSNEIRSLDPYRDLEEEYGLGNYALK